MEKLRLFSFPTCKGKKVYVWQQRKLGNSYDPPLSPNLVPSLFIVGNCFLCRGGGEGWREPMGAREQQRKTPSSLPSTWPFPKWIHQKCNMKSHQHRQQPLPMVFKDAFFRVNLVALTSDSDLAMTLMLIISSTKTRTLFLFSWNKPSSPWLISV